MIHDLHMRCYLGDPQSARRPFFFRSSCSELPHKMLALHLHVGAHRTCLYFGHVAMWEVFNALCSMKKLNQARLSISRTEHHKGFQRSLFPEKVQGLPLLRALLKGPSETAGVFLALKALPKAAADNNISVGRGYSARHVHSSRTRDQPR